MKKKNLIILGILIVLIIAVITIRIFSGEDNWICSNGQWVKHGYPVKPMPTKSCSQTNNNQSELQTYNYVGPVSFSINYPNGWSIQSSDDTGVVFFNQSDKIKEQTNNILCQKVIDKTWKQGDTPCNPEFMVKTFSVAIAQKDSETSLDDFINSQPGADTILTRENLTIKGLNAIKTTRPAMYSGLVDYLEKDNYVLIIPQYTIDEKTFNDFLDSMEFANLQTQEEISTNDSAGNVQENLPK